MRGCQFTDYPGLCIGRRGHGRIVGSRTSSLRHRVREVERDGSGSWCFDGRGLDGCVHTKVGSFVYGEDVLFRNKVLSDWFRTLIKIFGPPPHHRSLRFSVAAQKQTSFSFFIYLFDVSEIKISTNCLKTGYLY